MGLGLVGTAAVVAGCTPKGIDRRPRPGATVSPAPRVNPRVDPDVALAATVLAEEQALLDRVVATVARHPELEATLSLARSAHQAHVDLLKDAVPHDARIPRASPSASPSVAPSPSTPAVPARTTVALRAVAVAEDRLALVGRRSSFAAESGAFARVLASMAAAAAQQAAARTVAAKAPR